MIFNVQCRKIAGAVATAAVMLIAAPAGANEFEPQIRAFYNSDVKVWLSDPAVVDAVKAQNAEHAGFDDAKVDALDQQWRAEKDSGSGPLIDKVLTNALSQYLQGKKESAGGKITEVFVMDDKGLNVGQSDVTSDYMQGDEAKWQKTYGVGPDAVFVDEVEFDDSTESFQSQVSGTVVDPATGEAIGAITVGVAVENL